MKFILVTHGCMASLNPSKSSQLRDLPGGAVAVTAAGLFKALPMAKMAYLDHCREFHRNFIRCGFIQDSFLWSKKGPLRTILLRVNFVLHVACGLI